MTGIVSISPTIDKTYLIDSLTPGRTPAILEANTCAAGKAVNIAKIFKALGREAYLTGFAGGSAGQSLLHRLDAMGLTHDFLSIKGNVRTNVNIIEHGSGRSTLLCEPSPDITPSDFDRLSQKVEALCDSCELIILTGALPASCDPALYARLIESIKSRGRRVFLDTCGAPLAEGIKAVPYLVKPNEEEMAGLSGLDSKDTKALIEYAVRLQRQRGISYVLLSLGERGAALIGEDVSLFGHPPPVVPLNTVGCGDSMVAAFTHYLLLEKPVAEAFSFALGAGAANTLSLEPAQFDLSEALRLTAMCNIENI